MFGLYRAGRASYVRDRASLLHNLPQTLQRGWRTECAGADPLVRICFAFCPRAKMLTTLNQIRPNLLYDPQVQKTVYDYKKSSYLTSKLFIT